jgi:hypothetical protein
LLGLRVENRTLIDLTTFCSRLLAALYKMTGEVAVVIDGHNTVKHGDSRTYPSDHQQSAARPPVEVEQEIVEVLRKECIGRPIHIISTIAQPLGVSVFWCQRSNFFVTMWGAGLAKYRWICNKPGLVVTSRWNLIHRSDLRIYDAPESLEGGSAMEFLPTEHVSDDPAAPLLLPETQFPPQSISNFEVNEYAVFERVRELLTAYAPRSEEIP